MSLELIRQDLSRLSQAIEHLKRSQSELSPNGLNQIGQAQLLSQYYTGLESVMEKVLKKLGLETPSKTSRFHKEILNLAIEHRIIPQEEVEYFNDLLSFRHFVRHGYGVEFRPEEVNEKARLSIEKWPVIRRALEVRSQIQND